MTSKLDIKTRGRMPRGGIPNQAPPLVDFNPFGAYPALGEALEREGAACASRLGRDQGHAYGTLPSTTDFEGIVERAWRQ